MLVLFDIDGTLVRRAGPHHGQALVDAVRDVTGIRCTTEGIPLAGMLDRDILRLMMRAAGISRAQIESLMPVIVRRAARLYRRTCPDLRARVCPGVPALLQSLQRRQAVCGLVTGNLRRIGWRKIERAGLRRHFRLGAFSDMGPTRAALASLARREAHRRGFVGRDTRVILIGDTPNDIEAARANGMFSIAVATGVYPADQLAPHRPDLLVEDLRGLSWPEVSAI